MDSRPDKAYYTRLKQTHILVIMFVAVIPLMAISWSASHYYRESWMAETSMHLERMAENRSEVIGVFLKSQMDLLSSLVKLNKFEEISQQRSLEALFSSVSGTGVIVDLGVVDAAGNHLSYVGPFKKTLEGKNYANAGWFREVMINGSYVSDVFVGYRGVPHFVVAVTDPLKTWVLRATINSEIFYSLLESAQIGPKGDAFIVNKYGEFQTPSRLGHKQLPPHEMALLAYHNETVVRQIKDDLYVTTWLRGGQWLLVVKMDIRTFLGPFFKARNLGLLIIALASILIITVTTLVVRYMVNKIEAADRERALFDNEMLQVEKMALIGRMAASVAHEINNPLQMIGDQTGWIGELLEDEDEKELKNLEEYRESLKKIKVHVKRASAVTHRLLGFSRKMEAEKAAVDVNKLLEETSSFLETEAKHHHIAVNRHLQPDIPHVMTDASQLQQVFLNILNNAIEAIGKDGAVDITTRSDGKGIAVEFADTGPGIAPEVVKKIFDPFFTTKGKEKGTGLGLSISYNIMQRLGGEINVRNKEGEGHGSVFTVTLPIVKFGTYST